MNNNFDFEGPIFTRYTVICPSRCTDKNKQPVIGNAVFRDDSSICLAAI